MLKEILASFKLKRNIKEIMNTIKFINGLIYSEKFDFNREADEEEFFNKITTSSNRNKLCQLFKIANRITRSRESLEFVEAIELIKERDLMEAKLKAFSKNSDMTNLINQELDNCIELNKLKIRVNLMVLRGHILGGKEAFKKDPYSFQGIIYQMEKAGKRAITFKEMSKIKEMRDELELSNKKLEEINLKRKQLND